MKEASAESSTAASAATRWLCYGCIGGISADLSQLRQQPGDGRACGGCHRRDPPVLLARRPGPPGGAQTLIELLAIGHGGAPQATANLLLDTGGASAPSAASQGAEGTGLSPVVNAGDGSNEHPTQALVDIAAMRRDGLDGRTVVLMGNLRDHRVHHSLARLLGRQDVRLVLVSPAGLELPPRFLPEGAQQIEATDARTVDEVLATADFVYMTPVQYWNTPDARHGDVLSMDLARARRVLRREAKVLHPFPRLGELAEDLDGSPWDGYHAQTALGPEVRRRTLALLLDA